jgi:hypothetical protein
MSLLWSEVRRWSVNKVSEWLVAQGLSSAMDAFRIEQIDGEALLELDKEILL